MYLNVLDEVSKNLEVLLQRKGPDGAARLHLEEYFSTFFLPAQCCKQRRSRVTTVSKKHQIHDANADMIPLHHAKPCSLSRVKFACPISNQLDLYIYVPPLSAKLKTVTLWPRKQSSSGSKSRVQEIRCAWSQHAKIKGLVSQMQRVPYRDFAASKKEMLHEYARQAWKDWLSKM